MAETIFTTVLFYLKAIYGQKNETNRFFSSYHGIRILLDFSRPRRSRSFTEVVSRHKRYSSRRELPTKPKKSPWTKNLPHKNLMPNFRTLKISRTHLKVISHVVLYLAVLYSQNNAAGIRKHYYKSSDYFENPENHCLNQATNPPSLPPPGHEQHAKGDANRLLAALRRVLVVHFACHKWRACTQAIKTSP